MLSIIDEWIDVKRESVAGQKMFKKQQIILCCVANARPGLADAGTAGGLKNESGDPSVAALKHNSVKCL